MFGFSQDFNQEQEQGYITCSHLLDSALSLGLNTDYAIGLNASMETEQLQSVQAQLEADIAQALAAEEKAQAEERRRLGPTCHIGPYANRICTICGLRQP